MGFYIRKSVNLGGGLKLNISGKGLGLSAGVKGFRVGVNGRGTYVHMGRGGLYYRKQFSFNDRREPEPISVPEERSIEPRIEHTEDLQRPIPMMNLDSGAENIAEHFRPRPNHYWIPIFLGIWALLAAAQPWLLAALLVACVVSVVFIERAKARDLLVYDLEEEPLSTYERFVSEFERAFSCSMFWQYTSKSFTHDLKRNAGAHWITQRRRASSATDTAKKFRSNISIPALKSGSEEILFLPDYVVVLYTTAASVHRYSDVAMNVSLAQHIESDAVPHDARIVDHTWRYPNKNGGPDRRFRDNYEIPVCLYEQVEFKGKPDWVRAFLKSSVSSDSGFLDAFRAMSKIGAR